MTATGQAFEVTEEALLRTLTQVANTWQQNGIKFAVAGGCTVYARGGPPSDHDVDIHLKESDPEAAAQALVKAGMRPVDPPEDWLTKVYNGDLLVDLIFTPNRRPVTDVELDRAVMLRVGPAEAPVVTGTDLLVDKLLVLGPHRCDFTPILPVARGLHEQVEWPEVAARTSGSAYAQAFLALLRERDVVTEPMEQRRAGP